MMINLVSARDDRSAATQRRLWQLARELGPPRPADRPPRRDAPHGPAGRPPRLGGRHASVMSGFRATADPTVTDEFRVTHAIVLDPLYPLHSTTWGRSPAPGSSLTPAKLGHSFVPRRGSWSGVLSGTWVIVQPIDLQPRPGML